MSLAKIKFSRKSPDLQLHWAMSLNKNINPNVIIYTKYYIFCTRCNQQSLFLEVFKRKLLFMYKTHMEIAINNNDLIKFEKEWSQFLPLVNSID